MKTSISSRFSIDFPLFSHCLWRISASLSTAGPLKMGHTRSAPFLLGHLSSAGGGGRYLRVQWWLGFSKHTKNY
jgi:hypothetical protein